MAPLVSICIPTYNRASSLQDAIRYMLAQTYTDFELIVCDDASPDNTREIVQQFEDKRLRYHRNETNLGLYGNWNQCIRLAVGDYIAIYHDHDVYLPTIVEESVALLNRYPTASFAHTALLLVDHSNAAVGVDVRSFDELTPGSQMIALLANGWSSPIMAATAMVRRAAYERVGLYDNFEKYGFGCDMDMWFRLSHSGDAAYVQTPQALIRVREKGDNTSTFRWTNLVGAVHMHRDHINQEYQRAGGLTYLIPYLRFVLRRDYSLALMFVRAALLEPATVVDDGMKVITAEAGWSVKVLAWLVKRGSLIRGLLKKFFLPSHYERVSRQENQRRQQASEYLRDHPELTQIIEKLSM